MADIRQRVFNHLLTLHPGFFEANRASEIQSRLTADTALLRVKDVREQGGLLLVADGAHIGDVV